jgi:DNA mismatch repair protein MutS2
MSVVSAELDLHALTVEEALPALDRYLNAAFMAGYSEVRIVHGKGSGILRQAVNRELRRHPLVKSFRIGGHREGQTGCTIVQLVER